MCKKSILCVWWDSKGILDNKLLVSEQTIIVWCYSKQLAHLNQTLEEEMHFLRKWTCNFAVWQFLCVANAANSHLVGMGSSSTCSCIFLRPVNFKLSIVLFYATFLVWLVIPTSSNYWKKMTQFIKWRLELFFYHRMHNLFF